MLGRSLAGFAIANAAALSLMGSVQNDNIFVIDGDGHYDPRSDLQKTADEISKSLNAGQVRRERQPDPARQSAAELKRDRKAERLKAWAEKGAIGVQHVNKEGIDLSEIPEAPAEDFAKAKTVRKRPAPKKAVASVAKKVSAKSDPFPDDKPAAKKRAPKKTTTA